ncbi:MAG: winged helix-turn-helix domain-containing protein [Bacteroidota bacterium]
MLKQKTLYTFGLVSVLTITLFCAFSMADDEKFVLAKQEVMLRKIGHELLLQSGDSLSRVLPIKKLTANEYQITFENEFTFNPDSLVAVIKRSLAKHNMNHEYIVNVLNCEKKEVIFGYAVLANVKDDIIPCTGRIQPKNCYFINIKFQDTGISTTQKGYLLGGLPLLAFVGLIISKSITSRKQKLPSAAVKLGQTIYNETDKTICINKENIDLTLKENKLLSIFAKSPNQIIERTRLQKEIWEDEGVIVGRSLDVFISRLRKKLENDTSLQLINIHNKGYKLQIKLDLA